MNKRTRPNKRAKKFPKISHIASTLGELPILRSTPVGQLAKSVGGVARLLGMSKAVSYAPAVRSGLPTGARALPAPPLAGGVTAVAGDAPVAFSRSKQLRPFMRITPSRNPDGCIVHGLAQLPAVSAIADDTWQNLFSQVMSVGNPLLLPWIGSFSSLWERYMLRQLRIHYQHYAPTTYAGEVVIKYTPDPDEPLATDTEEEVGNGSNFVRGAVYEDFCLDANLSGNARTPLDVVPDGGGAADSVYSGAFAIFVKGFAANGAEGPWTLPGNFFIEVVIEYFDRHQPEPAANGFLLANALRDKTLSEEQKLEIARRFICHKKPSAPKTTKLENPLVAALKDPDGHVYTVEKATRSDEKEIPAAAGAPTSHWAQGEARVLQSRLFRRD